MHGGGEKEKRCNASARVHGAAALQLPAPPLRTQPPLALLSPFSSLLERCECAAPRYQSDEATPLRLRQRLASLLCVRGDFPVFSFSECARRDFESAFEPL